MAEQKKFLDAEGLKYLWQKIEQNTKNEIADLVNSAPEALDTLGELATELQNHEDAYDALLETVGNKLGKTEQAADSAKLNGQSSSFYAKATDITSLNQGLSNLGTTVNNKLGKTEQAADSAKLGGIAASSYATQNWVSTSYLTKLEALESYLSKADAQSTYLTITNAGNTYLTISDAENTYQPVGDYAFKSELAIPLSNAEIISIIGGTEKVLKSPKIKVIMGEYDNSIMGQYYSYEITNTNDVNITFTGNDNEGSISGTLAKNAVHLSKENLSASSQFDIEVTFEADEYESTKTTITVTPFVDNPGTELEAGGY